MAGEILLEAGSRLQTYVDEHIVPFKDKSSLETVFDASMLTILAARLNDTDVSPRRFVRHTRLVAYDARRGINGDSDQKMPEEVVGLEPEAYAVFCLRAVTHATQAFGKEFGTEVLKVHQDTKRPQDP